MRKKVIIPVDVSDVDLAVQNGKPYTCSFQLFLREFVLSWAGFDESTDMLKVSQSILNKFSGRGPHAEVVLTETEWEKGKKALEAAQVPAPFRAVLRPFRMAWYAAEDVKEEEIKTEAAAS